MFLRRVKHAKSGLGRNNGFFAKCIEEPTGCEDSEYCQWFLCSTLLIFLLSGLLSNEC